jgi:hypothetical protein
MASENFYMISDKQAAGLGALWTLAAALSFGLLPGELSPLARQLLTALAVAGGWAALLLGRRRAAQPSAACRQRSEKACVELTQSIASSVTQIKPQLAAIECETERVLALLADAIEQLSEGFHGMHRQTEIQRQLSLEVLADGLDESLLSAGDKLPEALTLLRQQAQRRKQVLNAQAVSAAEVELLIGGAVKGLQVNDLVSQLIGHVLQRVAALQEVVAQVESMAALMPGASGKQLADEDWQRIRQQAGRVTASLQTLQAATEKPPVAQQSMHEGEIELF